MRRAGLSRSGAALLALVAAAICTGCASSAFDSDQPPQQVYVIAAPAAAKSGSPVAADITVTRPIVQPGLDTDRIAVSYPDRRLDYYAASRWNGDLDLVVQSLMVEALRNSGRLRTVQGDVSAFGTRYLLQTEITDFQAEYARAGEPPAAHVAFVATLGRSNERQPLGTFAVEARVAASANTLSAIVEAFEAAFQEAANTAVSRTIEKIAEAEAASDASG